MTGKHIDKVINVKTLKVIKKYKSNYSRHRMQCPKKNEWLTDVKVEQTCSFYCEVYDNVILRCEATFFFNTILMCLDSASFVI